MRSTLLALLLLTPLAGQSGVQLTIPAGTRLELALPARTSLHGRGQTIVAALTRPVYVDNRLALAAGTPVRGVVTATQGPKLLPRVVDAVGGDFRPPEKATIHFQAVEVAPGRWQPLDVATAPQRPALKLVSAAPRPGSKIKRAEQDLKQRVSATYHQEEDGLESFVRTQTRWQTLKNEFVDSLPYHPLALGAGTRYPVRLQAPLRVAAGPAPAVETTPPATLPAGTELFARLDTGVSSATAKWGDPVSATVTRPVLDQQHRVMIPQGTKLLGSVVEVKRAHWLGRGGTVRFSFDRVQLPKGLERQVQARLSAAAIEGDAKIGAEGAAKAVTPGGPTPYVALGVVAMAAAGKGDADNAWSLNAGSGTHLRIWSSALALLTARWRPLALGLGLAGSAHTIYGHWIRRGPQMVFPKDTALEITIRPPAPHGASLPGPKPPQ